MDGFWGFSTEKLDFVEWNRGEPDPLSEPIPYLPNTFEEPSPEGPFSGMPFDNLFPELGNGVGLSSDECLPDSETSVKEPEGMATNDMFVFGRAGSESPVPNIITDFLDIDSFVWPDSKPLDAEEETIGHAVNANRGSPEEKEVVEGYGHSSLEFERDMSRDPNARWDMAYGTFSPSAEAVTLADPNLAIGSARRVHFAEEVDYIPAEYGTGEDVSNSSDMAEALSEVAQEIAADAQDSPLEADAAQNYEIVMADTEDSISDRIESDQSLKSDEPGAVWEKLEDGLWAKKYLVEEILDSSRDLDHCLWYQVKWSGSDAPDYTTWEPYEHLADCIEFLADFHWLNPRKSFKKAVHPGYREFQRPEGWQPPTVGRARTNIQPAESESSSHIPQD